MEVTDHFVVTKIAHLEHNVMFVILGLLMKMMRNNVIFLLGMDIADVPGQDV